MRRGRERERDEGDEGQTVRDDMMEKWKKTNREKGGRIFKGIKRRKRRAFV